MSSDINTSRDYNSDIDDEEAQIREHEVSLDMRPNNPMLSSRQYQSNQSDETLADLDDFVYAEDYFRDYYDRLLDYFDSKNTNIQHLYNYLIFKNTGKIFNGKEDFNQIRRYLNAVCCNFSYLKKWLGNLESMNDTQLNNSIINTVADTDNDDGSNSDLDYSKQTKFDYDKIKYILNSDDAFLERLYFDHKMKLDALAALHQENFDHTPVNVKYTQERNSNKSKRSSYFQDEENESEDPDAHADYKDLLRLVNSGMMKHFGDGVEEDEESIEIDDENNNSEGSRHIDQSMQEEDKFYEVHVQTEPLDVDSKQIQYIDLFHQDFECYFNLAEFNTSTLVNTDIVELKDVIEQVEPETQESECRTNDVIMNEYAVDTCNFLEDLMKPKPLMVELMTQTDPHHRNVGCQYNFKPRMSSVSCGISDLSYKPHMYEAFVMTDELQIQERIAQTEETITKDIYINVGVDKWDDKSIEAAPTNYNKKIQVFRASYRDIGLQVMRLQLHFSKGTCTEQSMVKDKEVKNSSTITEIDSEMWFNIDQASKKMIALLKNNNVKMVKSKTKQNSISPFTSGVKMGSLASNVNNKDDDMRSEKSYVSSRTNRTTNL